MSKTHAANCPVGDNFACTCDAEDQLERYAIGVRGDCEFEALETIICDLRACLKQILPTMNPRYQGDTMRRISALLHGNSITNEIIDYWIDGAGGVDTKVRAAGCVDHLDKAVDMERIKEPRIGSAAQRPGVTND